MTTVREVFAITMALIDELSEATGAAETSDTRDYQQRVTGIINVLTGELYPHSDTYETAKPGKRPISKPVSRLEDEIGLDDFLCRTVLPCGLAARLVYDENPSLAMFYDRKYTELLAKHGSSVPVQSERIQDVYGGLHVDGECGVRGWQ